LPLLFLLLQLRGGRLRRLLLCLLGLLLLLLLRWLLLGVARQRGTGNHDAEEESRNDEALHGRPFVGAAPAAAVHRVSQRAYLRII
jgi:hypothetical protein